MKYYHYISDAKVEMLLPQLPNATKHQIAAEFKFDIKIFQGRIETKRETLDSRIARLAAVTRYIESSQDVGTVDSPKDWITGTVRVKTTGFFHDAQAVAFTGTTGHTIFVFGGSAGHLLTSTAEERLDLRYSFLPRLLAALQRAAGFDEDGRSSADITEYLTHDIDANWWYRLIQDTHAAATGPMMNIEFVARTLLFGIHHGQPVLLATPLYVADAGV